MRQRTPAMLALEDGTIWHGYALGAVGERAGEAVFNTSMTGYQEVLTDPSYYGQIVVMTAPHIGNTGVTARTKKAVIPGWPGLWCAPPVRMSPTGARYSRSTSTWQRMASWR